jgi:hypothetical protein
MTHSSTRKLSAIALAATTALGACKQSDIDITNPNSALAGAAAGDPTALQLLATGLAVDQRGTRTAFITNTGTLGREMYTFTPNEGRNTTHFLIGITAGGQQRLDPTGFANGSWGGNYGALRDIYNFKNVVTASNLTAQQKSAALGYAQTLEALMVFEVLQTRDTLGVITEVKDNPFELAPFVTRDSGYKYVLNTLDDAYTKLTSGGSAFPFSLPAGFTAAVAGATFNTPATYGQFNRAIKARASANYATAGGGANAWQAALTALGQSFLNAAATSRTQFDVGVYDTYAPSPDTPNPGAASTNTTMYLHMSLAADVQKKADGTNDNRYVAKTRPLPSRTGPAANNETIGAASTLGFNGWATTSSPIAIIRNEELILLRAEARLATGDKAGAIADLNQVRVNSGGLPPSTLTAASTTDQILDGILYEKRLSLLAEGHRWVDMRRYGRLNQLPLDNPSGPNKNFVAKVMPIPQAECLNRVALGGAFVGPNGQNNCQ